MKIEKDFAAGAKRWMLVDDDEGILSFMRQVMGRLGLDISQVESFHSPQVALAAFEAAPESYELVITDYQMPGMDGVEFSHRLLALSPKIKILLMTGSSLISDEVAAQEGFSGLLQKPFPVTALQRALAVIASGQFSTNAAARTTA